MNKYYSIVRIITLAMSVMIFTGLAGISGESLFAQETDTVYIEGGLVIGGKCNKLTPSTLTFETADWGTFQFNVGKVKRLKLHYGPMLIESSNYKNFYTNKARLELDTLFFETPDGDRKIMLNEINFLMPVQTLIHSGFLAFGHQFALANKLGLFNLEFKYEYNNLKYLFSVSGSGIYALNNEQFIRTKENLNTNLYRAINNKFAAGALLTYDRNFVQKLLARYQLAAGIRYQILSANTLNLSLSSGGMVKSERSFGDIVSNRFVIPILISFGVTDTKNKKWSMNFNQYLYYSNFLLNRIRSENEFRATAQLTRKISFTTFAYTAYDTMPLSPIGAKLDYGWTAGLRVGF
jgi:hypothetical protein